ncbi:RagB/SusD family nutrient uptake outer membrane protein [Roseisolibacter sp. H3M3-2]|uniref:RagB/SusD family nutrient uptake outer membrane protein n=1 Tax=Roseisolibacter sp. H3M3-2 TaxID=3031323 RepID=UPI0023D9B43B|nr:RagB/SusD family nutrient uptake outer membrane protein [Roseisolibacter sp. H3M3-2]MDF1503471.1 RagB/SusD family nutrient uptake outer membrane protein [Roseisolibacter sp. H3M3-2]
MPQSLRRRALGALLFAGSLGAVQGCTDLTETPRDALTPQNAFKTDEEILAGSASVYAQLRRTQWAYYNLSEITTDEQIVPTRGSDWFDNGRWIEIYRHTWGANSGSALDDMNGLWNDMFSGVAKANLMISVVETSTSPTKDQNLAELRTLRAWFYYVLMDMFGGVPLVTSTEVEARPRVSRDSLFRFIENELNAARTVLPERASAYGRVNRHVANAILANMYLNARVFQGTVTAAGLQPAAQRWQNAIDAADRVINSGVYSLNSDYRANFTASNSSSPELIFVINNSESPGLGNSFPQRSLHYNQHGVGGGPWNGFATIAETYRSYNAADVRRGVWLAGPQVSFATGQPTTDRAGAPLVFTETIGDITRAGEGEGPRLNKFSPFLQAPDGDSHPHDFPYFRLAEMYMIKAEALNELGRTAEAITILNQIRARAFEPDQPLAASLTQAQTRDAILRERLYEFAGEAKRRQDMIRLGGFTAARQFKNASEAYRVLFPIPATQIQNNPQLVQNAGY